MLSNGKRILLLLVPFMLIACSRQAKTPEFFLLNPEYIQPVYDQCVMVDSPSDKRSIECVAVMTVIPVFKQYISELMSDASAYGSKIMQAQIRLVELQKKLKAVEYQLQETNPSDDQYQKLQAQKDQLEQEVYKQELLVNSRRAVIRVIQKIS